MLVDEEAEEKKKQSTGLEEKEVIMFLQEAEREFEAVRTVSLNGGAVAVLDEPVENPPNVQDLIESATLANVECLCEMEPVSITLWKCGFCSVSGGVL
jgi:hypothetical protein